MAKNSSSTAHKIENGIFIIVALVLLSSMITLLYLREIKPRITPPAVAPEPVEHLKE
jgi:hypothetical protein